MLDNERYNQVFATLEIQNKLKSRLSSQELNEAMLLDENYKTQVALAKLSINLDSTPKEIPGINAMIGNPKYNGANYFSLVGMPNSGRTSSLLDLIDHSDFWIFGDAARRSFGLLKTRNIGSDFASLVIAQIIRSGADFSFALDTINTAWLLREKPLKINVIFERDVTDIAFIRASFLTGRIDAKILKIAEENFVRSLSSHEKIPRIIVSCLVQPSTSLAREKEKKTHLVVQPHFLRILYEQYMRFHWEMQNFENVFGFKRNLGYLALDMSNEDIRLNKELLFQAVTVG